MRDGPQTRYLRIELLESTEIPIHVPLTYQYVVTPLTVEVAENAELTLVDFGEVVGVESNVVLTKLVKSKKASNTDNFFFFFSRWIQNTFEQLS